jgi:hypothetical protein
MHAIIVTDARTGKPLELCRVGSNPEAVADGARRKTYTLNRRQFPMYSRVEIVMLAETQS